MNLSNGKPVVVHVRLKGINHVQKRLADGTIRTYYYAWKGGPQLPGKPGDPSFMAAYNAAVTAKVSVPSGTLKFVIARYEDSAEFGQLAPRTKADYRKHLDAIGREFGSFPIAGLTCKRARVIFSEWKDELAKRSLRQADYAWTVFARCLSWALGRGLVDTNPLEKGGRLYRASRAEFVWTDDEEAQLMAVASPQIALAFALAIWTGQRQGDLLRLTWSAYDGSKIRLRQGKTGARVVVPVAEPLKAMLDATPRRSPLILTQRNGQPWTEEGFRSSWRKAVAKAAVEGRTFQDLRGTAVTRLATAGATEAEIATLTGHSLKDVRSILDTNYLHRDPQLAESAIRKLERRTKTPN
jgi:integrase